MTTPHTTPAAPDLAAIEARAKAARDCGDAGALGSASSFAADVYVLLAHIAATRERHAAEVAAARAEALREAEDACRAIDDAAEHCHECGDHGADVCAQAVAALGAKGGA